MYWEQRSAGEIRKRVFGALEGNIDYHTSPVLGIPGTFLDPEEFYDDAPFLENAPFISTLISNPNHIGCHTLTKPAYPFAGTQQLEIELINLCAEQIFGGEAYAQDGYVAPGGTEANIQAMWIYRNYFKVEKRAKPSEIALVYSEDAHYSMPKGANLLGLDSIILPVDNETRRIDLEIMEGLFSQALNDGKKHFIIVMNMGTTMFGSIDDIQSVTDAIGSLKISFKIHVDAAFGGFIFPFTSKTNPYTFSNPHISSITIDAHKLLQAPYGTGIFLIRKGLMHFACTEEASYIPGKDYTICGSRSGANAVSVWMILYNYGSEGWRSKMQNLVKRTADVCHRLDAMGVIYFREPTMNIITIRAEFIPAALAEKYLLVADNYEEPAWWKIVLMPHVSKGTLDRFLSELQEARSGKKGNDTSMKGIRERADQKI